MGRSCLEYGPCIDTPFSPSTFSSWLGSMSRNSILIDEEQEKENSPLLSTTPGSKRPTHPPVLMRICPFGTRTENVADCVFRNLFE